MIPNMPTAADLLPLLPELVLVGAAMLATCVTQRWRSSRNRSSITSATRPM